MHDRTTIAGIWIRVSTEDQAAGESPKHHEARARAYAEARGWDIATVYDLSGVSGKTVASHPECKRMLEDVRHGRVTALIFSKLARLARSTRELLDFAEYFEEHRADLVSLQESIDTSTPAGRFFYTTIAGLAQWEREEIADRVKASVRVRAKLGKPTGGAAPFGYQWKDKQLVPDPKEAPIRRRMYELFADCQRVRTVARLLNEEGHRTRRGARFSDTTVRRLLQDPTAKGKHRANYTKSLGEGKQWETKPECEWIYSDVEPVVSAELWNECNAILDERRKNRTKRPTKRATHLFAGLTLCHCGSKMYVPSNTPKYVCYACRHKIPVDDLERVFVEQLRGFLVDPEEVRTHLKQNNDALVAKQDLVGALHSEQKQVADEIEKLYQLYVSGNLSADRFGERNRRLDERLRQLGDSIPRLQGEIDYLQIREGTHDDLLTEARDLYARWYDLPKAERRTIVEAIVDRIEVGETEISFSLSYLPVPPTAKDGNLGNDDVAQPLRTDAPPSPSSFQTATKGQRNLRGS